MRRGIRDLVLAVVATCAVVAGALLTTWLVAAHFAVVVGVEGWREAMRLQDVTLVDLLLVDVQIVAAFVLGLLVSGWHRGR